MTGLEIALIVLLVFTAGTAAWLVKRHQDVIAASAEQLQFKDERLAILNERIAIARKVKKDLMANMTCHTDRRGLSYYTIEDETGNVFLSIRSKDAVGLAERVDKALGRPTCIELPDSRIQWDEGMDMGYSEERVKKAMERIGGRQAADIKPWIEKNCRRPE